MVLALTLATLSWYPIAIVVVALIGAGSRIFVLEQQKQELKRRLKQAKAELLRRS